MPRSNKRTASLPNPFPVGLQSRCSIWLRSLPLRLCQATAPQQTHTRGEPHLSGHASSTHHQDTCSSVMLASSLRAHIMLGYPPFGCTAGSMTTGIPATLPCQTPAWSWSHSLPGYMLPPKLTTLQALLSPSYTWNDRTTNPWTYLSIRPCWAPAMCGMTGAPPCWERHQPSVRQPHPIACQEPCPSGRAGTSSSGFRDNHSIRLLLGLQLEGSKHA
jgi:hypothetical protein